ncbi:hypothetical protein Q4S41_13365 [Hymenobacter sp. CA1UV-4]|nr:hypothetical protein [Hymenobacter sp. CA1UV-4]
MLRCALHDALLKFLGSEQHVAEIAERGNGEQQQGEHHGSWGLNVIEKVNRLIEKPEAAEAGNVEHRNENERVHKRREMMSNTRWQGLAPTWAKRQIFAVKA